MNERIKHLAEQAGSTHKQSLGVYQFYEFELEKFTELIVQECIKISYDYDRPKLSGPGMVIANRIEEHFGVENENW